MIGLLMSALPDDFTNLRVHSHFSLMQAVPSVEQLVERAVATEQRALALTDHRLLTGVVAFDRACRAAGIKPLIGLTVDLAQPPDEVRPDGFSPLGELTLLARSRTGYQNLCRLSSLLGLSSAALPALLWDDLKAHHEGLVCLTGGRKGWLERYARSGNLGAARRHLARLAGLFDEACFLALTDTLVHEANSALLDDLLKTARGFGVPAVAVRPVYVLDREDESLLPLMSAIRHNTLEADLPVEHLPGYGERDVEVTWPDANELANAFAGRPELLAATSQVANLIGDGSVLPDGSPIWPRLPRLNGRSPAEELRAAANDGLRRRYPAPIDPAVQARLARELTVITESGFAPFFLLVADIVRFAREAEIPVSTRGSVANSLVAYSLLITTVDPIEHDLLFERFLNPARRSLPDIDLDFCSRRRDAVLNYVRETYGAEQVALVATINTLQPRSAVRETGKAYGLDNKQLKQLARKLPRGWHPDPRRRRRNDLETALVGVSTAADREMLTRAYRLVGLPDHLGIHPGGLVITPGPLTDIVPVHLAAKGFVTTQYEHEDVEAIGLPKIDLLGIRALTVLADAADLVRRGAAPDFHVDDIPPADGLTGNMLAAGETIGVFQCESDGARRTLRQLRARSVADLADASAFFKPGPATGGMARAFVRRYRGEEKVTYLHPALEPILGRTKGVLLFQEQVLRLATEIAGLSWADADQLRRGMSKFDGPRIEALAQSFVEGCCRPAPEGPGMSRKQATTLWEQIVPFAGYGFNQGHATAYADVSYRSAYLKARWPAEFLCARLANGGGFHHPAIYMAEARRLGIAVRPPHVNHSGRRFTLSLEPESSSGAAHPALWMGLAQIRGLRRSSVTAIVGGRQKAPYRSLADLLERVTLRDPEVEALIQCGALEGLGDSRAALLDEAHLILRSGSSRQMAFGFATATSAVPETAAQRLAWEMHLLGLPVATDPLALFAPLPEAAPLHKLPEMLRQQATIAAYRLPGWTGSSGYFFGDGATYMTVRLADSLAEEHPSPVPWVPYQLGGRWLQDEWRGGWFQVEQLHPLEVRL